MIYYNSNIINDWNFGDDNIIKVYKNGAVCYYKFTSGDTPTPVQEPCFAVVDNISQYSDTEFEDVFDKATEKWYKLNNLDEYEQYGVYGSGRNITYYDGKLTIDDGYEYQYSGGSWVNVGEVSGSTTTLPNIPFVLNYNAKNYDAATHSIPMTSGQLNDTDAVAYNNPNNIVDHSADGYITVSNSSMRIRKQGQDISLFNRSSNSASSNLTIVCKAKTTSGENIITNRDGSYNWMYRLKTSGQLRFHGRSETGSIAWNTSNPDIMSVRTYYDSGTKIKYNNWTQNTSTSPTSFTYGSTNNDSGTAGALFVGYGWNNTNEQWSGDFYWVYMAQANLTDAQIQEVIDYNEGGGGQTEYPKYYDEIQDPPDNVTFTSMTEAEAYECPWVGMHATIDGDRYIFSGDSISGYEWVEVVLPYDAEIEYLQSSGSQYINTNQYLNTSNFEVGYSVLGNRGYWGYVHNNVLNGAWVTVDETTAFFGSFNYADKVSVSSYISSTENTIVYTQSGATINGTTISKNLNLRGVDNLASVPLLFFALHDFYNNSLIYSNSKFKSFYLKNNGELVVDMIPVRVGQVGYMYDRVSGELFGNVGSGSFILGPDK